jgi:hypothetical protein
MTAIFPWTSLPGNYKPWAVRQKTKQGILIFVLAVALSACGASPTEDCTANFLGSGVSVKVTNVSTDTYRFELCGDSRATYPAFTVYGAAQESDISQSSILARYRLSHVVASRSGDAFEVTFNSDLFFVLFADTESGGSLQYSNATELVRGSLTQAF